MTKCPTCQADNIKNTIFCSECGHYLLKDKAQATLVGYKRRHKTEDKARTMLLSFQPNIRLRAIRLRIGVKKHEIEMPLDKIIHLGRLAPASDVFPEIDLTDQGLFAASVSRRHARISKRGATVVVEDMDSGNGTYVNGQKLSPYLPEVLSDGDTLQLGQLPIEVKFLPYR